jgi:transcriptional regulator with XRE-family HTH domain
MKNKKDNDVGINNRIKLARLKTNLSAVYISRALNLSDSIFSQWKRGNFNPSTAYLIKVAKVSSLMARMTPKQQDSLIAPGYSVVSIIKSTVVFFKKNIKVKILSAKRINVLGLLDRNSALKSYIVNGKTDEAMSLSFSKYRN